MTNKQAYWINLAKTNPDEFKRQQRKRYWLRLKDTNPKEFDRQQREWELRKRNPQMTKQEAHERITLQDRIFEERQLSLAL